MTQDENIRQVAAKLLEAVNAPEQVIYRVAREIVEMQPHAEAAMQASWRSGLDDLSRELLAILAHIETAARMAVVLADDPEEEAAWVLIRDKAAEGAVAYRAHRFPAATEKQAD
jgi:hypothetical protein